MNTTEYHKEYYKKNRKRILARKHKFWYDNKEKLIAYHRKYEKINHDKIRKQHNVYENFKRKTDPSYKLRGNLKARIYMALKHYKKAAGTTELLGADLKTVKKYLESKFTNGMNWENMGKWHIDHIKPCSAFDLSNPKQQRECFNYLNIQPLWAFDNLKKSDNFNENTEFLFVSEAPLDYYLPNRYQ